MLKRTHIVLAALLAALFIAVPGVALATTTLTVSHTASSDPNHFTTIQQAIDHVASVRRTTVNPDDFLIEVAADANNQYLGAVIINDTNTGTNGMKNVVIEGERTKDTIVTSGSGAGVAFTISGTNTSNITIRRFTFITGTGVSVSGATSTSITNNVFKVGNVTAIQNVSPSTTIVNNTFYLNGTSINTSADITIKNNIFSSNTPAITGSETAPNVLYNLFNPKANAGIPISQLDSTNIPNTAVTASDPKFVDPGNDFHLDPSSPAVGAGAPTIKNPDGSHSDMGAYGGPNAEPSIPQVGPPTLGTPTDDGTGKYSVPVSWSAVTSSTVTQYFVRYGLTASTITTPLTVPAPTSGTPGTTITGLKPAITGTETLTAPRITGITVRNQALDVKWDASSGADASLIDYTVTYTPSGGAAQTIKTSSTSTTLPNLVNGTTYSITVQAKAQTKVFVTVSAADANGNEGPASTAANAEFGPSATSPASAAESATPSASVAYPYLKGEGCFIATAAYGFYSAWQVQALRDFRDRYLMTNGPGRAFVNWYYHYGPIGAHYLNQHPVWKPLVRVLLFPLVVGAIFLTATSSVTKVVVLALLLLASTVLFRRKAAVRWGGVR